MAPLRDSITVKVVSCPNSDFEGSEGYAGLALDTAMRIKTLDDVRERVLDGLELDSDSFTVQLHPPNDCTTAILPQHLDPASDKSVNEWGKSIIYAHIKPKGRKASTSHTNNTQSSQSALASQATEIQSLYTQSKKPVWRKKASAMTDMKVTKSASDNVWYIRIGTEDCEKDRDRTTIPREIWLVAQIPITGLKKQSNITFLRVDTWNIGGIQIGHCEEGDKFDLSKMPLNSRLDPAFLSTKASIMDFLHNLADDLIKFELVNSLPADAAGGHRKNDEPVKLVQGPTTPECADTDAEPDILQPYRVSSKIGVLIYFKNKATNQNPCFEINQQAALRHSETYNEFEKYIMNGDGAFKGLKKNPVLSKLDHGFRLEIWVLPHIARSSTMYSWTRLSHWRVCDWLSDDVVKQFNRYLYIEVHVMPAQGKEGIGYVELDNMKGVDSLLKAVEDVTESEDDEEIKLPPKKRKKHMKRLVEPDIDDDDNYDDDDDSDVDNAVRAGKVLGKGKSRKKSAKKER